MGTKCVTAYAMTIRNAVPQVLKDISKKRIDTSTKSSILDAVQASIHIFRGGSEAPQSTADTAEEKG